MYHYLKHSYLTVLFIPLTALAVVLAPQWAYLVPLVICAFHIVLDIGTPPEMTVPRYRMPWLLDALLYLHLPVSALCLASLLWLAAPGDLWGIGRVAEHVFGMPAAADAVGWLPLLSAAFAVGFILSTNTLVAHELVHRTTDRLAMITGRLLLGLVGDAQFSISHVYGHHVNVGTPQDPATARRGEGLYAFALRSAIGQYCEAWEMESRRLQRRPWWWRAAANKVVTGLVPTALAAAAFYVFAGARGLAAYAVVFFTSKLLFEAVNYIEHYGLVRVPGTPVEPRHSWDCNTRAASNVLMNLSRHSHHHADARVKYWALAPQQGALDLSWGYIAHIALAMVPPLWHRFAAPELMKWDETMATAPERELARAANDESRHPLFNAAAGVVTQS